MRETIQYIYNELKTEIWTLTERRFSVEYLGKSETYLAYLKSKNAEPSVGVLVHLWGKLDKEKRVYEYKLRLTNDATHKHFMRTWIDLYTALSDRAFNALKLKSEAL